MNELIRWFKDVIRCQRIIMLQNSASRKIEKANKLAQKIIKGFKEADNGVDIY